MDPCRGRTLAVLLLTFTVTSCKKTPQPDGVCTMSRCPRERRYRQAKCATGTVQAAGKTDEYYYVFDGAGTQLASGKLGSALSLFPGKFQARLNSTPAGVDITANAVTKLKPGTLNVLGSTDEYYYVFNTTGTQLASSKLNQPLSFPAGSYSVKVGSNTRAAAVTAGQSAVVNW